MFNGQSFAEWINSNIIPIIVAIIVLSVLWAAATKKVRDFALGVGLGLIALGFTALMANWQAVGEWVRGILFGG